MKPPKGFVKVSIDGEIGWMKPVAMRCDCNDLGTAGNVRQGVRVCF